MAKRGGFPGGGMPGNMANLMKQAQKMQRQMEEQQKALDAMNRAKGFIRNEIGRQVKLRHTPELIFKIDHSMEYGRHISKIIRDLDIDHEDEE